MSISGNNSTVVFFGTGPVAAASLELLVTHQNIEAVITKPKPLTHRGEFPVHEAAKKHNLLVIEVSNRIDLEEKLLASSLSSPLGILIDFGIIVSKKVIDYFEFGIVNSHFSRLPEWRGADPITFSLLSGQKSTAVSLMLVDEGMDTGKILVQKSLPIKLDDTNHSLTNRLIQLSDQLLESNIPSYLSGEVKPRSQPHQDRATYSRKLTKEDGSINWSKPAAEIEREVRAFKGWPKSYATLAGKTVVITAVKVTDYSGDPSEVVVKDKQLHICCGKNSLQILQLKPAGKKEMTAEAFLAGHRKLLSK
jgi:methionyl-tRNA formyltransferase